MNNKTKILIGIGIAGIAYLLWKRKSSSAASVHLPVEKIDEQIKKELPSTPETPSTPSTPSTPATPAPATPSPATPAASEPVVPVIPPFDFEQYFKDHPIVIDPNIGSSLVNTNIPKQQKCMSVAEWLKMKENGTLPPINSYCVEGDALIISDKDRLQNAFQMKDVNNELSRDMLDLNSFMRQGKDHSDLEYPEYYGGNNNGQIYNKFSCDPFGFGGIPSC